MKRFILSWIISGVSIYVIANILSGVDVSGFEATLIAAAILGAVNIFIRPILVILTLPINLLTLGLFTFVINGFVLKMTAALVTGFYVRSLFDAIIASLLISIVNMFLSNLIGIKK
ncbi:MAG: phage holin family protein [Clostridiaceae bacterium]|nr:phage holin family protein [Clostridiaceae bacterium]